MTFYFSSIKIDTYRKCAEEEEYISHLEREWDSPAERSHKGLLMEGSFGAVVLKERIPVMAGRVRSRDYRAVPL